MVGSSGNKANSAPLELGLSLAIDTPLDELCKTVGSGIRLRNNTFFMLSGLCWGNMTVLRVSYHLQQIEEKTLSEMEGPNEHVKVL